MIALALLAAAATSPTSIPKPIADVQACRGESDPARRLACYDGAVAALALATEKEDVVIVDRQEIRKARKGLFGFSLPRIGFLTGHPGKGEDDEEFAKIDTKVTSVRPLPYGRYRVVLEGGAVWETIDAGDTFREPKAGDAVTVERALMGAYRMKVGKARTVQAKRVG